MGGTKEWGNRAVGLCSPSEWPDTPMVGYALVASLNLTYAEGKRLLNDPLRVSHDRASLAAPA
jgi:hypothetical protein